jgi:phosphate transport system substrate-binding protein
MNYFVNRPCFILFFVTFLFIGCKNSDSTKETIIKGTTNLLVDESFQPIIEDQVAVFQSRYKAKIVINAKSEKEVIREFLADTARIVILSRKLNDDEKKYFEKLQIKPKVTQIASDAIALISNKSSSDTLISVNDLILFMQGKAQNRIKGLVFDNPNSSTVRYINDLAGVKNLPKENVFSFKSNKEVIKFVAENEGMIGVVGLNWLYQPSPDLIDYMQKINVLSVQGKESSIFFAPTQNNLAEGSYPLARDLFIINCQGTSGLGMGFASFVAGDVGQRIVLKSGLLPIRIPTRKLLIKTKSKNDNK